jgi:hypothetical protein
LAAIASPEELVQSTIIGGAKILDNHNYSSFNESHELPEVVLEEVP